MLQLTACKLLLPPVSEDIGQCTYTFHYEPPEKSREGSAGVTVAFVKAGIDEKDPEHWKMLKQGLNTDLEAMLLARGLNLRGPYQSRDELTYGEKEAIELLLYPQVQLNFEIRDVTTLAGRSADLPFSERLRYIDWYLDALSGKTKQVLSPVKASGKLQLDGRLELRLIEPMSGEKLWVKALPLSAESLAVTSESTWLVAKDAPTSELGKRLLLEPAARASFCELLNKQYQVVARDMWRHLDPRELKSLTPQAKVLKSRVVYPGSLGMGGAGLKQ
jgi:hypothetical protein